MCTSSWQGHPRSEALLRACPLLYLLVLQTQIITLEGLYEKMPGFGELNSKRVYLEERLYTLYY